MPVHRHRVKKESRKERRHHAKPAHMVKGSAAAKAHMARLRNMRR